MNKNYLISTAFIVAIVVIYFVYSNSKQQTSTGSSVVKMLDTQPDFKDGYYTIENIYKKNAGSKNTFLNVNITIPGDTGDNRFAYLYGNVYDPSPDIPQHITGQGAIWNITQNDDKKTKTITNYSRKTKYPNGLFNTLGVYDQLTNYTVDEILMYIPNGGPANSLDASRWYVLKNDDGSYCIQNSFHFNYYPGSKNSLLSSNTLKNVDDTGLSLSGSNYFNSDQTIYWKLTPVISPN